MKKVILLGLISSILISGCAPAPVDPDSINSDTLLDQQLYKGAVGFSDASKCERIVDEALGKDCSDLLTAMTISESAYEELDVKKCEEIALDRYKEECVIKIEDSIKGIEAAKKIQASREEQQDIFNQAMETREVDLCKSINDHNSKYSCIYNIVVNDAISDSDPTICDQIEDEKYVDKCKTSVDTAKTASVE